MTTNEVADLYDEKLMFDIIENDNFLSHIYEEMPGDKSIKILAIFNCYVLENSIAEAEYVDYATIITVN